MALTALNSLVTLEEADAYAALRNWTDWDAADDDEDKAPALIEGTTFVLINWSWPKGVYYANPLSIWPYSSIVTPQNVYITGTPDVVKAAVIEAARLRLGPDGKLITGKPLVGGNQVTDRVLKRKKTGSLEKEWESRDRDGDQVDRLALVTALLRSTGAVGGLYSVNVPLRRV